jgi:hypothetical protein
VVVKTRVIEALRGLAVRQGLKKPGEIAQMVFLILEGVWASVRMFRDNAPLAHARQAVRLVAGKGK